MKKIFTLMTMGAFVLVGKNSQAQISENFESGLAPLTANCWQFTSMMYATSPSSYVINDAASLYSEPPVSADSIRITRTPLLTVDNSIDVSFVYRLSNNLTGQAYRKITLDLTDVSGAVVQNLITFNVPNNATTNTNFSQTFAVTTPGVYRLSVSLSGGQGAGSVRLSIDDLYESETVYGCPTSSPLPVKLIDFHGNKNESNISLQWTVAANETADHFIVERSADGRNFMTAGVVMTDGKFGAETYSFNDVANYGTVYYRLRMFDKDQSAEYSKTLMFRSNADQKGIKIINNPTTDKLTFNFSSSTVQVLTLKLYDVSGRLHMTQKLNAYEGNNTMSLPLASSLKTGMYVVELTDGTTVQSAKFIKQ